MYFLIMTSLYIYPYSRVISTEYELQAETPGYARETFSCNTLSSYEWDLFEKIIIFLFLHFKFLNQKHPNKDKTDNRAEILQTISYP